MTTLTREVSKNLEVTFELDKVVGDSIPTLLADPKTCWQPTDFLPDFNQESAFEEIRNLQARAKGIPDEVMVSLIGNIVTEEALPSYHAFFSLLEGVNPAGSAAHGSGWARWSRAWTAEENRHGDLLSKYLYLSGRADMRQVEVTIQELIIAGFEPQSEADPYQAMIYTSFQERATKIAHVNTAKLADKAGDTFLGKICKTIAGDEARHEKAYKFFMSKIFELDPNGAILAFEKMMRKQIVMPAALLDKDNNDNLYARYAAITQKMGIYTAWDYAKIIDHLVKTWRIEHLTGLEGTAQKAQHYLCGLAARYERIADRIKAPEEISLAWLSC